MDDLDFVGCISCMNTNDLYNLCAPYSDNVETYAKMFETCFDLKVLDISKYICAVCSQKLEEAVAFKDQTLKNIAMLQSIKDKEYLDESILEEAEHGPEDAESQEAKNDLEAGEENELDGELDEEDTIQALDETTCIYCDLQLSDAAEVEEHVRSVHGLEPRTGLRLPECEQRGATLSRDVEDHINRCHGASSGTDDRRFPCHFCDNVYTSRNACYTHLRMKHGLKLRNDQTPKYTPRERKKCHICERDSSQKQILNKHLCKAHGYEQQILLNQQNQAATRIITQQGTIVAQGNQTLMQHTVQNGPVPQQNSLTVIPQRPSPQSQQAKKVIVQPDNANDMDDLEESITAAILTKHTVNEPTMNVPQQFHSPAPSIRPQTSVAHQMNFNPQLNYQQMSQTYEQPLNQGGKGKRPAPERQIYKTGKACPAHMVMTETTDGVLVTFHKTHIGHGPCPYYKPRESKKPKTETQQILLNQQNQAATRIITQQGTIVAQGNQTLMQHTVQNGPVPQQNSLTVIPQRPSPQSQQAKKVIVQPDNANDMDDLEESITAAILTKHTVNEPTMNVPQQFHSPAPSIRPQTSVAHQMNFNPQLNYQQMSQTYEQPLNQGGKGKRPAPERQIYKTGKACPAHMVMTETTDGVLVTFHKTHIGHGPCPYYKPRESKKPKTETQQILLNQQNQAATRIITQQGTIVAQGNQTLMQHTVQNGPVPQQNSLTVIPQRPSPQSQQAKKVIVQPDNANDMDDLEESITAAILTKHTVNEPTMNVPQQFHSPAPSIRPQTSVAHQMNFNPQLNYQQMSQTYEQPLNQGQNQVLMETDLEDERQVLTLSGGQRITLAEYKRIHQPMRVPGQPQLQQPRNNSPEQKVRQKHRSPQYVYEEAAPAYQALPQYQTSPLAQSSSSYGNSPQNPIKPANQPNNLEIARNPYSYTTQHFVSKPVTPDTLERSRNQDYHSVPYNYTTQDLTKQAPLERSYQDLQNGAQAMPQNLYPNLAQQRSVEGFVVVNNYGQQRAALQPSAPPVVEVNTFPDRTTPTQKFAANHNAPGPSASANSSSNKNRPRSAARARSHQDKLNCPTCSQRLGITIFQCSGGHSSCNDCRMANRSCGTCMSPIIDMRNIMLEAYIAELRSSCPSTGCTLSFNAVDMERHLKECPFGEMDCPMGTFFGQCSVRCKVADMAAHFDIHHKEQRTAEIDKEMYVFNICVETHKLYLLKNGPYTYLVHVKVGEKERKIFMTVQLLGSKISAEKWTYEFHVYNKRQPLRKFLYMDCCQSIGKPVDEIFNENQCATLPLSYAMTFVNESTLTYKFFIKKNMNQRPRKGGPRNASNTEN